jgi:hypothetical protein
METVKEFVNVLRLCFGGRIVVFIHRAAESFDSIVAYRGTRMFNGDRKGGELS